jgi:hypothetical protein
MKSFSLVRLLVLACATSVAAPLTARAQGGPPFLTNDPGTPGAGRWELNLAWLQQRSDARRVGRLPHFDLNYGVGNRFQLNYEVGELWINEPGSARVRGMTNSGFGVKWRFRDHEAHRFAMSIHPQFEFRNPGSSSAGAGLVADENRLVLPFQIEKEFAHLVLTGEIGYVVPSKSDPSWLFGVVLGRRLSDRLEAGIDLHGECSAAAEHWKFAALVGVRAKVSKHFSFLGAIGREVQNDFERQLAVISYLALRVQL